MQDLIKRLVAADGPDRELDAEIWEYLGLAPEYDNSKNNYGCWHYRGEGRYHFADDSSWGKNQNAPLYTSSLDAAMTLVEDGYFWTVGRCDLTCHATVGPDRAHFDEAYLIKHQPHDVDIPNPSTPALALCAAALRARQ